MPYELTLTIALEIAHPQIQYELRYDDVHAVSHDLNTFRLVCKAFDIIGKKAWGALAKVYPKCGYNTLCLPPKEKSLMDLAKIFLANEGVLGKLVTNIRLTVLPSTHAEFVNHGFGIGQWNSERPETPLCHSVVDQVHRRVIAVEQLMIGLGMSSNQMDFLRNAVTPASQAMLELILDKIPNAVSLDILTPDDMSWRSRVVTWVDEYDYVGCCKLMSSVSSQYDFASLTLSFGDLELVTPLPFSLSVPRITSMHIRTSEAFLERDTIIKALAIAKELTTLHLALEWAYHGYNQHMELLTSISVFPKLEYSSARHHGMGQISTTSCTRIVEL